MRNVSYPVNQYSPFVLLSIDTYHIRFVLCGMDMD